LQFCKNRVIIEKCGCYSRQYPAVFNANPCLEDSDVACTYTIPYNVTSTCMDECPPECEKVSYDCYSSFDTFPSKGLQFEFLSRHPIIVEHFANDNVSQSQITYEMVQSSVACVYIYFDAIRYTSIVQYPSRLIIVINFQLKQYNYFLYFSKKMFFEGLIFWRRRHIR
jgi:hypothetical protein